MTNINLTLLKNAIEASSLRQDAINSNIANINTDNYKTNQVAFETLLTQSVHGVTINKIQEQHLGSSNIADIKPIVSKRTGTSVKENGNNVDLDMEMVNLAENSLYYQALISQLNGQYSRLKTIIGG